MIIEITKNNLSVLDDSFISKDIVLSYFNNNPFAKFLVFIVDNTVVGYLYYSDIYDRIEINQITVSNGYRKKGYASMLLSKLISFNKPITLEVKSDNIAALSLYRKHGFKEVSIRKGYYNGIDGILMLYEKK